LPNALDVVSRAGGGDAAGAGGQDGTRRGDAGDPSDRGGFKRAGAKPGSGSGTGEGGAQGGAGKGDEIAGGRGAGDTGSEAQTGAGDPRTADRARRYNEKLYAEPVEQDKPVEGEAEGVRTEADVIHLEGDPVGREDALRDVLARSGMSGAEAEAVFERVPPAYRDAVAAYLMRIARDEASAGTSDSARSP
jgi:hypothetical protein